MLNYNIRGKNIEVTDAIKEYTEKKISKLERYFPETLEANVHVNLRVYPNKDAKVEVTIPLKNLLLRAEAVDKDLYASVDLVVEKLERQIHKYKTRVNRKNRDKGEQRQFLMNHRYEKEEPEEELEIVRTKQFSLKPMNKEEAVLQMELSEHKFYIFNDAETNRVSVVYRRKDGKYGLIETN